MSDKIFHYTNEKVRSTISQRSAQAEELICEKLLVKKSKEAEEIVFMI